MKPAFRPLPMPLFKMVTSLTHHFVCLVSLLVCSLSSKTIYYSSSNKASPSSYNACFVKQSILYEFHLITTEDKALNWDVIAVVIAVTVLPLLQLLTHKY